jgi:hypothetical protein
VFGYVQVSGSRTGVPRRPEAFGASSTVWLVCLCRLSAGACRYQLARASVPVPAGRNWPAYWPQDAGELRAGQVRADEFRGGQIRAGQDRMGEDRFGEVRAGEANRPDVALGKPAPDRGNGCTNVGPQRSFPGLAAGI